MITLAKLSDYIDRIHLAINNTSISGGDGRAPTTYALGEIEKLFRGIKGSHNKIIFIGNGGSNAVATHMAEDYTKCGEMRAICFNDGSLLTCLANDFSFEDAFAKAVEFHALPGDILVAISSSGKSINILNAVAAAKKIGCIVITLSGFMPGNPLSRIGDFNIHVPAESFGVVENAHQIILHCILDEIEESCKIKK